MLLLERVSTILGEIFQQTRANFGLDRWSGTAISTISKKSRACYSLMPYVHQVGLDKKNIDLCIDSQSWLK
jgi:hypothetical protein